MMQALQQTSPFFGANAPYIEALYEQYLADPASVPENWRQQFDALPKTNGAAEVAHTPIIEAFATLAKTTGAQMVKSSETPASRGASGFDEKKSFKVLQYIRAHRVLGSRHSSLDPLKRMERMPVPELELAYYGLSDADLNTEFGIGSWQGTIAGSTEKAPLKEIVNAVKRTYCG
ncbi:MAG: 2-oxoglutarate dehydrogenase E1 component, partial [Betaproteobacteria bacterium]|nr:2-oxoglutarate dehydrogenase E1 component [Betaproteobacteria bacterium]